MNSQRMLLASERLAHRHRRVALPKKRVAPESGISEDDLYDLFQLLPDGCQKRLYLRKTASVITDRMELPDLWLNKIILFVYKSSMKKDRLAAHMTNRESRSRLIPHIIGRHPAYDDFIPTLLGRLTEDEYIWYKTEGPDRLLSLRLQHVAFVTGKNFAQFIGMYPGEDLYIVRIARDNEEIDSIVTMANRFWPRVENKDPPEKFPNDSRQCLFCKWYGVCHEKRQPASCRFLDGHVKRHVELGELIERLTLLQIRLEGRIASVMGDATSVDTYWGTAKYDTKLQTTLDAKRLLEDFPQLKGKYTVSRPVKKIVVVPRAAELPVASCT